ncbi:MAG: PQQ-dependent sugar dehydrogenase [Enterobacterales bacterium]|nr:PQQ-dependent sugar dehydrogenase [Enterobacterales bacterium]
MLKFLIASILWVATLSLSAANYEIEEVADGFNFPWSMAFLPDGSYLVSEKAGDLIHLSADGKTRKIVKGMPKTLVKGQGGLADILLDQDFENNSIVYITYASGTGRANHLKMISAKLVANELVEIQELLKSMPAKTTGHHYGARMAWAADGKLLVTVGDGGSYRDQAQFLNNHFGKILRLNKDGSVPKDNPFTETQGAMPEIYSYGHRNPQAILVDPQGQIWSHEHGPKGGDELNLIKPGANYGWPAITYGIDYSGAIISPYKEAQGMEQPVTYWVPSIAPAGMTQYFGEAFPEWQGNLFVANLAERSLRRLSLKDNKVVDQEIMLKDRSERLRDVRTGPDGYLYVLTDSDRGKILRIKPGKS